MYKKILVPISILLLIIVLGFDFFILKAKKQNCLEDRIIQKKYDENIFNNHILSNLYLNEDLYINECLLAYKNDSINIKQLVKNNSVLIFRFSELNCSSCVEFVLEKLKCHFPDFEINDRIAFIYDCNNTRSVKNMFGKAPFFSNNNEILGLPIETKNTPFLFLLNQDLKVTLFFIPEKTFPELTDKYCEIIKTRFFDKN